MYRIHDAIRLAKIEQHVILLAVQLRSNTFFNKHKKIDQVWNRPGVVRYFLIQRNIFSSRISTEFLSLSDISLDSDRLTNSIIGGTKASIHFDKPSGNWIKAVWFIWRIMDDLGKFFNRCRFKCSKTNYATPLKVVLISGKWMCL